jgi:hypothetical protein
MTQRIRLALLGLGAGLAWLGGPALAAERPVGLQDQTGVAVTIYNQDLALVRDRRTVTLDQGENHLAFIDVSAMIRPETALLAGEKAPITILEQNFDFDLLTPEKLLEKSVGDKVRVITTNPATGAETVEEAVVLSVANGVVLQVGDRIETNPRGRIVFSGVPAGLRARPTLVLDVSSPAAGQQPVELSYLTGGLAWRADYVAKLSADESHLDLNGLVTLTNTSGTTYKDAYLQLVAGDVNVVKPQMMMRAQPMAATAAPAPPKMAEESLFEYHLYTLDRPTTIAQNQTKQVAMLSAASVPVRKEYRFVGLSNAWDYRSGDEQRVNAEVRLAFDNKEEAHLGMPLPKGIVRVYKDDSGGRAQFVGEDEIEHTPNNEVVRLQLGQAFDVTARSRQTDFEKIAENTYELAFAVEIKNAKKVPIVATVLETVPGTWKMLSESLKHDSPNSNQAQWQVPVPAEGRTELTYRIRVKF